MFRSKLVSMSWNKKNYTDFFIALFEAQCHNFDILPFQAIKKFV